MKKGMKTKTKISGHIIRGGAWAVFLSLAFLAFSSASNSPNTWQRSARTPDAYDTTAKPSSQPRAFSFAERVAYQRIIEDVYWRHRIWPRTRGENPDPKPALDAVMTQAQLENKVASYLRDSLALEDYWQRPITAEQLQTEMDRMARHTKQPEVLRELFEALGNDPAVIAECLIRPILAARLIADLSAQHQTRHVESPQTEALRTMSVVTTSGQVVYNLPEIADTGDAPCTDDTWTATTAANAPLGRYWYTAVWTGSEMIVWGGHGGSSYLNTGGRYNPATDSWTATSTTNAPAGRYLHTAVWTGSAMVVWGGSDNSANLNTGGRYNPSTDSWTATATTNAPSARAEHAAVWTGSEMIVWSGFDGGYFPITNTGGRYNPGTNTWTATTTSNAPSGRSLPTAVWTGNEMIVWGGYDANAVSLFNTGGRYNPSTDSWITTSTGNTPTARRGHTAVWTGSEMIVWGGCVAANCDQVSFSGGRYNPVTNRWTATGNANAPSPRAYHTAVWTGSEMIVWGGTGAYYNLDTGGRYNPATDSWTTTSTANAPSARYIHTAVWTGSEMIVWGGGANTGGRYCAQPPMPPITVIQPNGGEVWLMGSMHEIKWEGSNLTQGDRLIIQYSRDGGAGWFRIARDVPALSLSYSWRVDNFPTTQGKVKILLQGHREITDQSDANFTVQRGPPPPNDAFASAILLTGANGTVTGTNVNATNQSASGEPAGENSVWYKWIPPSNGTAHFNIGTDWLTIDVYTGTAVNALTRIATSSGSPSAVNWTAVAGTTYRIRLTKNTRPSAFHLLWTL
jgi:N-acetylneuraminic acid mutarotase